MRTQLRCYCCPCNLQNEDQIKNEGARVATRLYFDFQTPKGDNSVVLPKCIQACSMSSLRARMKKIDSKRKALEWPPYFSHYKYMGIFRDAQWQLTLQSGIGCGRKSNSYEMLIVVLVTSKNGEDRIKNKCAIVVTRFSQL